MKSILSFAHLTLGIFASIVLFVEIVFPMFGPSIMDDDAYAVIIGLSLLYICLTSVVEIYLVTRRLIKYVGE